jgi:hypothetical protein
MHENAGAASQSVGPVGPVGPVVKVDHWIRHLCPGEPLRLRRRGMLARGAARTGWPVYTGAASTSAAARRRRRRDQTPAWGWPSRWRRHRLGAEAGVLWVWFADDTLVPASLFDCAGAACLPAAQLVPAGLSTQAWRRRRWLHEGGGDVTRRRPGGWPSRRWHRARSGSRSLGARRRLRAPSHDWRALLAAAVHWRREHFARLRAGPDGASGGVPATPLSTLQHTCSALRQRSVVVHYVVMRHPRSADGGLLMHPHECCDVSAS